MTKKPFLKLLLVSVFLVSFSLFAQTANNPCTQETITNCYDEARQLYFDRNFEAAKNLFDEIIAIDVNYKQAQTYLKKCRKRLAKGLVADETQAQHQEREYPPAEEYPPSKVYRIGIGDVLDISVWRTPDLDKSVIVRPDGVISYPLVGDVPAAGLTLTELDQKLTGVLKEYVRVPEVSVAITRFGGTKVVLLGEVKAPGVYNISGGGNIIDVVALAGGFTNDAVRHGTFVIRGGLERPEVYRLNLARVFKGDLSQNIPLASNDIVYVPKKFLANVNYMLLQINPLLTNTLLGTSVYKDLKDLAR